jgi:hypothetical protein
VKRWRVRRAALALGPGVTGVLGSAMGVGVDSDASEHASSSTVDTVSMLMCEEWRETVAGMVRYGAATKERLA